MPNPRTIKSLTAFKFSDNEILARVAEVLDDDTMAFKVDIIGGLTLTVGDINIGAVNILNASDVQINPATEETLAALSTAFSATDFATETTLSALKTSFDTRDLATHAEQVLQTTRLVSLDGKDFATQATLLAFKTSFDSRDLATETTLSAFKTAFDSRDLATETTLSAFKTAFDTRDLATHAEQVLQTTRLVSLDGKDFATQTTLATMLTLAGFQARINTLGQKTMVDSTPVVLASDQTVIPVSQSGTWIVRIQDGAGNILTSQVSGSQRALDVGINVAGVQVDPRQIRVLTTADQISNAPMDGIKATYSCVIRQLALAAAATDIFAIVGSASKTIRITKVTVDITSSTNVLVSAQLLRRSTDDTGGTSTTPAKVPHDTNSAAATAVVRAYTANPTLGTLVGSVVSRVLLAGDSSAFGSINGEGKQYFYHANSPSQALVLRGTAQVFAVNLGAVSVAGGEADITVEWTEE